MTNPTFSIVSGKAIADLLDDSHSDIVQVVRETYLLHHREQTINPDSYFLRFRDRPEARIIALPAALCGEEKLSGIKWIGSYPANIDRNLQRASAVLVLNDYENGYPFACMEAAQISAARTCASAVLAAEALGARRQSAGKLAIVGAGTIARTCVEYFKALEWRFEECAVFDLQAADAQRLARVAGESLQVRATVASTIEEAIRSADVVLFATTAGTPHVHDAALFHPGQVVLHLSLRDLAPGVLLSASNILDDVAHCLKANTSPHLTAQQTGNTDFITGTLAQVLQGECALDASRPVVFSPFGLGVLDLAVGKYLFDRTRASGTARMIEDFFPSTQRW